MSSNRTLGSIPARTDPLAVAEDFPRPSVLIIDEPRSEAWPDSALSAEDRKALDRAEFDDPSLTARFRDVEVVTLDGTEGGSWDTEAERMPWRMQPYFDYHDRKREPATTQSGGGFRYVVTAVAVFLLLAAIGLSIWGTVAAAR